MNITVYVVDGWDERTDTAFCEVFLLREAAARRAKAILKQYGRPVGQGMFLSVGVYARKVK